MSYLDLEDRNAYQAWAEFKKASYDLRAKDGFRGIVNINADGGIPAASMADIKDQIQRFNFVIYKMHAECSASVSAIKKLGTQLGLKELDKNLCAQEDRLTRLTVEDRGRARQYIPYSNKAIGWHTDGYYNPFHQRVQAMILHCEQPAAAGGENDLLDPDMVYIHVRNENPDYIRALSAPGVMCIPENVEHGVKIRPQTCSAVFLPEALENSPSAQDSALAMRFSNRKHNIIWSDDGLTREALHCLKEFLRADTPYHVRYRLQAGEGVINNNVLHTRTAFVDDDEKRRVYYRARYYNRITLN